MKRIENVRIVLKDRTTTGTIVIEGKKISQVIEHPCDFDRTVIPGFIDVNTKGSHGFDFMDGRNNGGFEQYCENILKEGVTSVIQSTSTAPQSMIKKAIQDYTRFKNLPKKELQANHLGFSLEGPWINENYAGEHDVEHIRLANMVEAEEILDLGDRNLLEVKLAPEFADNEWIARYFKDKSKNVSVSNTNLTSVKANQLFESNTIDSISNLFMNMSSFNPVHPGLVLSALENKHLKVTLTNDPRIINPELIKFCYKNLGPRRMTITSNSSKTHNYSMATAFKSLVQETGCTLYEAVRMTAFNPAALFNYGSKKGQIRKGLEADLVILDRELNIIDVYVGGTNEI